MRSLYLLSEVLKIPKHPPISDKRICSYDGEYVTFWYKHPSTKEKRYRKLPVLEFIYCIVRHLPEKGFNMVVRYGLYSARYVSKKVTESMFSQTTSDVDLGCKVITWREAMIIQNGADPLRCEQCGKEMIHVSITYKRRDKLKTSYRLDVDDLVAIDYPYDEERPILVRV